MDERMVQRLKYFYELSPKALLRKIRHRITSDYPELYDMEEVVESKKYMRPQKLFDFGLRELPTTRNLHGHKSVKLNVSGLPDSATVAHAYLL